MPTDNKDWFDGNPGNFINDAVKDTSPPKRPHHPPPYPAWVVAYLMATSALSYVRAAQEARLFSMATHVIVLIAGLYCGQNWLQWRSWANYFKAPIPKFTGLPALFLKFIYLWVIVGDLLRLIFYHKFPWEFMS